nr:uncharacterized protein LOC109176675 [Ipomoea batatas]
MKITHVELITPKAESTTSSKFIADIILPKIEADLQYKIKYIQQDVKIKWGVNVDYKKAWYARVQRKWDESYNISPQTLMALQQTNLSTVVDIVANPTTTPNEFEFKYAFWAFKPAIDGFKYCLLVLTIDGTHLYGNYKGLLLLAVLVSVNKEIFPIAYSIVDGETRDSWSWFLKLLAQHMFGNIQHMCIIFDRHGGIDVAFRDLPKLSEPRIQRWYCLRHLRSNLMTKFKKQEVKTIGLASRLCYG